MDKGQFAILRFAKYKGPEIGNIEAHNERTKEKYASNPDVDLSRSKDNFHIVRPADKYRAMAEALIKQYGCPRVRSDSVRIVETLITASPEFFPEMGKFATKLKQYDQTIKGLELSKKNLADENAALERELKEAALYNLQRVMDGIPPGVVFRYSGKTVNKGRGIADEM